MSRFGLKKKLAESTISLIKEYEELVQDLRDGVEEVEADSLYESIKIIDCDGEEELELDEVSAYYYEEQEAGTLINEIENRLCKDELEESFEEMDKDEFIRYVGTLYYAQFRCEEIYKELKKIENSIYDINY